MINLVLQGENVATPDIKYLAKLTAASRVEAITPRAFRLHDAQRHPEVPAYCQGVRLDYAFVPTQTWAEFGLLVMDMDSTLISIECVDEIADLANIKPQVAAITASAMRGEIEFAESLTARVALLRGLEETALERVYEDRLMLNPGAEKLISSLKSKGIKTLLVSGGFNFFTDKLKTRLNLDFTVSNTLEVIDGRLTGRIQGELVDAQAKAKYLNQIRQQLGLSRDAVIAMGDGANDIPMMQAAGVSVAYHAKPIVQESATYAINYVGLDGLLNFFTHSTH